MLGVSVDTVTFVLAVPVGFLRVADKVGSYRCCEYAKASNVASNVQQTSSTIQ